MSAYQGGSYARTVDELMNEYLMNSTGKLLGKPHNILLYQLSQIPDGIILALGLKE